MELLKGAHVLLVFVLENLPKMYNYYGIEITSMVRKSVPTALAHLEEHPLTDPGV